jgi:nitroreductase
MTGTSTSSLWQTSIYLPDLAEVGGPKIAAKLVAQDSGHVCENLYLACEAIGCGTCAVAACW